MKYVILRTDSQKDGESFSVVTEKKAESIIEHKGNADAEIMGDVSMDIKSITSDILEPNKPPLKLAAGIIQNEYSMALIAIRNAKDMDEMRDYFQKASMAESILNSIEKLSSF